MPNVQAVFRSGDVHVVICPDGERRHAEPFKTRAEADKFADYGHACMAAHLHTFLVLPVDPFEGL